MPKEIDKAVFTAMEARDVGTRLFLCGKELKSRFKLPGGAVKHVQACLSAREDRESCFHHCRGSVSLVQACSCVKRTHNAVLTSEEML